MQVPNPCILPISYKLGAEGYIRPKKTYTDTLQNEEGVQEALKGYVEIEEHSIDDIPAGSMIRYITYDKKQRKELFRLGGKVLNVEPYYIRLQALTGAFFTVQRYIRDGPERSNEGKIIYTTRFFKLLTENEQLKVKMTEDAKNVEEILKKYEAVVAELEKYRLAVDKIQTYVRDLENENRMLKSKLKKYERG